ncbi:LysR family transcriptional regulator [Kribbella sp. CA-293567]|uniref:LysR family transcriptional regulator n=1 Tax=Kribbella sp. CA-293567 TaxID=3002436 RepID=UPI0022DE39A9|nr:LysR family transcriptional regulator [Kribbella sp. CA-293567]WBQ05852.1 LysR family transcriptional regulator [Kribbella sp. CA-293567]
MDLRLLESFVVVAEELNVGRAAVRLHLTQPTLSRQIATLERELGVELFARVKKRFVLTAAGETFLTGAKALLGQAGLITRDAQRVHRGELGTLRLRFVQSATFEALPRLLGAFREAQPDVVLDLETMTTILQTRALLEGRIDVGLFRPLTSPVEGLVTEVISSDPLVVALPAGHPLAKRKRVRLAELADDNFVLYTRATGPSVHDAIVGHCRYAGFTPRIVQEAADVQTIVSLVAAGLGVSLLIAPTPPIDPEAVVYRELSDDLPPWELCVAWSADNRSPVLRRFLQLVRDLPS